MAYPRNAFLRLWETRFHREFTTGAREAALAAGVDPNSAMGAVIQDSVTAKCLIEGALSVGPRRLWTCSTQPSLPLPDGSTTWARPSLTSLFEWEAVTQSDVAA